MRVLIVGAGAVGQAYGYHLQRGGCEVAFFVRPRHVDTLRAGLDVYPNLGQPRWTPTRFEGFGVLTSADEVRGQPFDQVWLTVPSNALYEPWLDELAGAWGEAGVVMLQPGLDDRARLLSVVPLERLGRGVITLQSFHAPLPGQQVPKPGIAWWFPPLAPIPLSGPDGIVQPAVAALRRGGCPAKAVRGEAESPYGAAILVPFVAAMEAAGWTLAGVRQPEHRARAAAAIRQALAVAAAELGKPAPWFSALLGGPVLGVASRLAPLAIPFDLETFLRVHFTKVGEQTRQAMQGYVAKGQARGLPVDAVRELVARLGP